VQTAAVDAGVMHAQQRRGPAAEQTADLLCLPADPLQGAIQRIVVVPGQPVGALVDGAGPLLAVDDDTPLGPITR
jgi:hypothetical protein